jgi:hypothetical protein
VTGTSVSGSIRARGTAATALVTGLALTLSAAALAGGPKGGHYAGAGSIYTGQGSAKSKLPVSFTLAGRKIESLTLGPAQILCSGGSAGSATLTIPRLTGFPAEKLTGGAVGDYTYYFEQQGGTWTSIGNNTVPAAGVPSVQVFAAFYSGKKFNSHGGIQIQSGADANGTLDAHGAYACSGSWDRTFAKRS